MVMLLLKALGIRRLTGWALRLIQLALLMALVVVVGAVLYFNEDARVAIIIIAVVSLGVAGMRALWVRQKRETVVSERTIDGKVVPEMLAAAALDIPEESPDVDYILRGLPDYGKLLLKLDAAEFAYIPEPTPEVLLEEPAVNRPRFGGPIWRYAGAAFGLIVAIGGGIYQASRGSEIASPAPVVVGTGETANSNSLNNSSTIAPTLAEQPVSSTSPPVEAQGSNNSPNAIATEKSSHQESDIETLRNSGYSHLGMALNAAKAGQPATEETEQAIAALRSAAQRGDGESEYALAVLYLNLMPYLRTPSDYAAGKHFLVSSASHKYITGEAVLAACYVRPCPGFKQSKADALVWYKQVMLDAPFGSDDYIKAEKAISRIKENPE